MQNKLTRREKEILNLLLDGLVPKEIAVKLKSSYEAVLFHKKNIYRKLDIHSIEELIENYSHKKNEILAPINMKDGTYFTGHIFNKVNLYANKWVNEEGLFYGEQYNSGQQILLSDIYTGTFDNLMGDSGLLRLKLSGTIDKECKNMAINLMYIYQGSWYYEYQGKWYNTFAYSGDKPVSIGPGSFSQIFTLKRKFFDTLPEGGYFVVSLCNELFSINHGWIVDSGERIPEDMPNGSICATISNLKIEPVL